MGIAWRPIRCLTMASVNSPTCRSIPIGAVGSVRGRQGRAPSSIYGADAIAGVVNVKLKRQITGFEAMAEGGTSQHGGGESQHYALSAGKGDLSVDGYNVFVTAEYRQQDAITLNQRGDEPWAGLNFTSIGGNDLRAGVPTVFNGGLPATTTPYLVSPTGALSFLGPGCNPAAMNAGRCACDPSGVAVADQQSERVARSHQGFWRRMATQGQGVGVRQQKPTKRRRLGVFGPNAYPSSSYGGNVSNPIGGTAVPELRRHRQLHALWCLGGGKRQIPSRA